MFVANNKTGGEIIVKKIEVVLQDGIKDCGVCSLLSIIRYYGGNVSKEHLKELTNTTKRAEEIGFSCLGMEGEVENIKKDDMPFIAHVIINKSYQHFVAVYDIDFLSNKVLIMDPAKGKRSISLAEFKLMTSHKFIFLKPKKALPNLVIKKVIFKEFLHLLKRYQVVAFVIISLGIIYSLLNILSAYHFKYLLEYAITPQSTHNVVLISITMMIIFSLRESANLFRNIALLKWNSIFDLHLTNIIFEQIISFPYLYYKNRTTGEILARIKDLGVVKNFITMLISSSIPEILSLVLFMILLCNLNIILTSYMLFFFVIIFSLQYVLKKFHKKRLKKYLHQEERLNSYLIEAITAFDVIKGLHMENKIMKQFRTKYRSFLESHYLFLFLYYIEEFLKKNLYNLLMILVLLLGAIDVIENDFSLGELVVFQSILMYSISSFQNLISLGKEFHEYLVSKERVEDLFTIHKENFMMQEYYFDQRLTGVIQYKNLTFSYHSYPLLSSVNITIPYGNKVFLYGESGSGKSTLVKALLQYVEVPFGKIKIRNIDINHYHLATLRRQITYVSQNEHLFTDTLRENIVMGREVADDELERVIDAIQLREVVCKMPLGLDTIIEENGFNLSGGERQRLILARSILKQSDIYIFDEASSQVDSINEREILRNMLFMLEEKTIIFVSHRFDNKDLFNQILHIEKGMCHEEKV